MNEPYGRDIHERIYQFVLSVFRLAKTLPRSNENRIITDQLLRSVSSMGANDQEANGAFSKADFAHCYTLVRKEAKETLFWLRLVGDSNTSVRQRITALIEEGNEIMLIVTSIVFKTRKHT